MHLNRSSSTACVAIYGVATRYIGKSSAVTVDGVVQPRLLSWQVVVWLIHLRIRQWKIASIEILRNHREFLSCPRYSKATIKFTANGTVSFLN